MGGPFDPDPTPGLSGSEGRTRSLFLPCGPEDGLRETTLETASRLSLDGPLEKFRLPKGAVINFFMSCHVTFLKIFGVITFGFEVKIFVFEVIY
jgi:hypothetical protein